MFCPRSTLNREIPEQMTSFKAKRDGSSWIAGYFPSTSFIFNLRAPDDWHPDPTKRQKKNESVRYNKSCGTAEENKTGNIFKFNVLPGCN